MRVKAHGTICFTLTPLGCRRRWVVNAFSLTLALSRWEREPRLPRLGKKVAS